MKVETTTGTISVLFREEQREMMRAFERALSAHCEQVAPGVVALHVRPGFWRRKDRTA
jgi:hypothetical protein